MARNDNFEAGYERGARARAAFAESFFRRERPKPFKSIKERMRSLRNEAIGYSAIRLKRKNKKKDGVDNISSASLGRDTVDDIAPPIPGQPSVPGQDARPPLPPVPPARPPTEPDMGNSPNVGHEFPLRG